MKPLFCTRLTLLSRPTVEDVIVDKPTAREVLIRTAATGACHSDLHQLENPCTCG